MLLKRYPPTLRSRQGSARDLAPSFAVIFVCMSAPPSRSWSIRPSVLRQARLIMTLHASTPVTLALHPALELRSSGCGYHLQNTNGVSPSARATCSTSLATESMHAMQLAGIYPTVTLIHEQVTAFCTECVTLASRNNRNDVCAPAL
mgnify:CR=1 FL=1